MKDNDDFECTGKVNISTGDSVILVDDQQLLEVPATYRAALVKEGILSEPEKEEEPEELSALRELKDNRKAVRNDRGRLCRQNADGTLERVHFHQRVVSCTNKNGKPSARTEIYMPGESWKDSRGTSYSLNPQGVIVCTDVRVKGKANKKALKKEKQAARRAMACSVIGDEVEACHV